MKAQPTFLAMVLTSWIPIGVALSQGSQVTAGILGVISFIPIMTFLNLAFFWKPWFMEGVDVPAPTTGVHAGFAAILDVAVAFLLFVRPEISPGLLSTRFLFVGVQLATIGKMKRDTITLQNDIKTPDHRRRSRNSKQS